MLSQESGFSISTSTKYLVLERSGFREALPNGNKKPGELFVDSSSSGLRAIGILEPEPQNLEKPFATYLNVGKATVGISLDNEFYFATEDKKLWQVGVDGKPVELAVLNTIVWDGIEHNGFLLLAGSASVLKFDRSTREIEFIFQDMQTTATGSRIDSDGDLLAYLLNKKVFVLDDAGTVLSSLTVNADFVTDVAIKGSRLYVSGYRNQTNQGVPVQSCFLNCYELDSGNGTLNLLWMTWGFAGSQLSNDMADTRLYRIVALANNLVLVQGESAGGNTVFRWNGTGFSKPTLVTSDQYNNPYNTKSAHILYYGLINSDTGEVIRGQFSIPRLASQNNVSNTNRSRTLAYSDDRIYCGSTAAYAIENRDTTSFLGKMPPSYAGSDAVFLEVPEDMSERLVWVTPGKGDFIYYDAKYALLTTDIATMPITASGQPYSGSGINSYFVEY